MPPPFHRRVRCAAAAALAVTALAAPPAGALPCEVVCGSNATPAGSPAPAVTRTVDDGFDWGSAAIGAGAGAAIALLSLGGATLVRPRTAR
jgi:hypothetical protein